MSDPARRPLDEFLNAPPAWAANAHHLRLERKFDNNISYQEIRLDTWHQGLGLAGNKVACFASNFPRDVKQWDEVVAVKTDLVRGNWEDCSMAAVYGAKSGGKTAQELLAKNPRPLRLAVASRTTVELPGVPSRARVVETLLAPPAELGGSQVRKAVADAAAASSKSAGAKGATGDAGAAKPPGESADPQVKKHPIHKRMMGHVKHHASKLHTNKLQAINKRVAQKTGAGKKTTS